MASDWKNNKKNRKGLIYYANEKKNYQNSNLC